MRLNRIALPAALATLLLAAGQGFSADTPAPAKGTAHITGHVDDADGKAAAGVTVRLNNKAAAKTATPTADDPAPAKKKKKAPAAGGMTTTTDADGNFKFDDLPAGNYNVVAVLKDVGRATEKVTLTDGQTQDVKLKLAKVPAKS